MKYYFFLLSALIIFGCADNQSKMNDQKNEESSALEVEVPFDWQGHRGARGLLPENTVPAFLKALEFPKISTLELDVVVSKDQQIVVSHEPWLSHHICSHSDGHPVSEQEETVLNIYQMTYAQIKSYDCGQRGNERFPEQEKIAVSKPTLSNVVLQVEAQCQQTNRKKTFYNIEIKSRPNGIALKRRRLSSLHACYYRKWSNWASRIERVFNHLINALCRLFISWIVPLLQHY